MSRKLAMCLICCVLSGGVGCKQNPANRAPEPVMAAASGDQTTTVQVGRVRVAHRGNGEVAVGSADGKQVILFKAVPGQAGSEPGKPPPGLYRVCDLVGDKFQCGAWTSMDTPCTECLAADPCPCTNPACASVFKPL